MFSVLGAEARRLVLPGPVVAAAHCKTHQKLEIFGNFVASRSAGPFVGRHFLLERHFAGEMISVGKARRCPFKTKQNKKRHVPQAYAHPPPHPTLLLPPASQAALSTHFTPLTTQTYMYMYMKMPSSICLRLCSSSNFILWSRRRRSVSFCMSSNSFIIKNTVPSAHCSAKRIKISLEIGMWGVRADLQRKQKKKTFLRGFCDTSPLSLSPPPPPPPKKKQIYEFAQFPAKPRRLNEVLSLHDEVLIEFTFTQNCPTHLTGSASSCTRSWYSSAVFADVFSVDEDARFVVDGPWLGLGTWFALAKISLRLLVSSTGRDVDNGRAVD